MNDDVSLVEATENSNLVNIDGEIIDKDELVKRYFDQRKLNKNLKDSNKKGIRKFNREEELKPYQAELIRLQNYLEDTHKRMIIIFEGRDASGKGGTIRREYGY